MFDGNPYFAAMSTRVHEQFAYSKCSEEVKDLIVPIVTLTRYKKEDTLQETASVLMRDLAGRPTIVDFDPEPRTTTSAEESAERRRQAATAREERGDPPARDRSAKELANDEERRQRTAAFNRNVTEFMNPVDGAVKWVDMISDFPDLLPVIGTADAEQVRHQLDILAAKDKRGAFRLKVDDADGTTAFFDNIRQVRERIASLLVILDLEDMRGKVVPSAAAAKQFFARLFEAIGDDADHLETVLLANGFPRGSLKEQYRTLSMDEARLYAEVSDTFRVRYGDYMSIPPRMPSNTTRRGWLPHVELVTPGNWQVNLYEDNSDNTKYIQASTDIVGGDHWPSRTECWGTFIIREVSETKNLKVGGKKFTTPTAWIPVRANQHLTMMALNR